MRCWNNHLPSIPTNIHDDGLVDEARIFLKFVLKPSVTRQGQMTVPVAKQNL
jgi:hypothetical protein